MTVNNIDFGKTCPKLYKMQSKNSNKQTFTGKLNVIEINKVQNKEQYNKCDKFLTELKTFVENPNNVPENETCNVSINADWEFAEITYNDKKIIGASPFTKTFDEICKSIKDYFNFNKNYDYSLKNSSKLEKSYEQELIDKWVNKE